MKRILTILALCIATAVPLKADPRYVTLTASYIDGIRETNSLTIEAYEVAELVFFPGDLGNSQSLRLVKNGLSIPWRRDPYANNYKNKEPLEPLVIAGPARIDLIAEQGGPAMATFKLTPEAFPADKTFLLPPGPGGASIRLECSTNLVHWVTVTNGIYTNEPVAKFFRLKADRIPGN